MNVDVTQIQPYPNDELWSPERFSLPPRSRLHHLEPIGIGTPMVESLSSYVTRLAHSHGLHVGTLLSREIAPLIDKSYINQGNNKGVSQLFNRTSALNGTGIMAEDLINVLNILTKISNLPELTFIAYAEILNNKKLFRSSLAWCPLCYEQWLSCQEYIYNPLIWILESYKVCSVHKIKLITKCPFCSHEQPILRWKSNIGYCLFCYQQLSYSNLTNHIEFLSDSSYHEISHKEVWVANHLEKLISSKKISSISQSKTLVQESLLQIIHITTQDNIASFAKLLGFPKNTVWMWCKGKTLPTLTAIIDISYTFNLSLCDFFNPTKISHLDLSSSQYIKQKLPSSRRKSPKIFDADAIEVHLAQILQDQESPPLSMKAVAKQLKHDRRTIYRYFPDLCRKISLKYKQYNEKNRQEAINQSCEEVYQIVQMLYKQGIYPSEARVSQKMSKPGYFRYACVRNALHKAKIELSM